MKRFQWTLQRFYDVTCQRERALRVELVRLSRLAATLRADIMRRRMQQRMLLDGVARLDASERLLQQQLVMRSAEADARQLQKRRQRLQGVEDQRDETMQQFRKTRAQRQNLEKLRQRARNHWRREQLRLEQNELDESAHVGFARNALVERATEATRE